MVRRQMRGRLVGWLLALLVLALAPLPARADTTEEVKHHYAEGLKRYNLGEYAKALDEFKAAYLGKPDPAFLFNIGQCQRQLAQFEDAARSYRAFLREGADLTKAQRDQVQRLIADMDTAAKEAAEHRALQPMATQPPKVDNPPRPGKLYVASTPSGAAIRLDSPDGAVAGQTPFELSDVPAGKHTVYLSNTGYQAKSAVVTVEPETQARLELTLEAVSAARTEAPARPRYWIAGVAAGAVVVLALGIGLGVGLSRPHDATVPSTDLGSMQVKF